MLQQEENCNGCEDSTQDHWMAWGFLFNKTFVIVLLFCSILSIYIFIKTGLTLLWSMSTQHCLLSNWPEHLLRFMNWLISYHSKQCSWQQGHLRPCMLTAHSVIRDIKQMSLVVIEAIILSVACLLWQATLAWVSKKAKKCLLGFMIGQQAWSCKELLSEQTNKFANSHKSQTE